MRPSPPAAWPNATREAVNPSKKAFDQFQAEDTVKWFEARGVRLHTEADGRMFPTTNDSQTIVDCLAHAATEGDIAVRMQTPAKQLRPAAGGWMINGEPFDRIVVATGGESDDQRL